MYRISSLNFSTFSSIVLMSPGVDTLSIWAIGSSLNLSINLLNCSMPFWSLFVAFVELYSGNGPEKIHEIFTSLQLEVRDMNTIKNVNSYFFLPIVGADTHS